MRSLFLVAALVLGGAVPALAQQPMQQVREACAGDKVQLCPNVQPGGGRILACFREHEASLSSGCRTALQALRAARAGAQ